MFEGIYLKRTLFIGLFWTFQVIPTFALYTFAPQILGAFGLKGENTSFISEVVISFFYLIGCIPALLLVNRIGRRPVIIWSFFMMTIGMLILGIFPNASIFVVLLGFSIYAFFSGGPSVLDYLSKRTLPDGYSGISSRNGNRIQPDRLIYRNIPPAVLVNVFRRVCYHDHHGCPDWNRTDCIDCMGAGNKREDTCRGERI